MKKINKILLPLAIGNAIIPTATILSSCSSSSKEQNSYTMSKTVAEWKTTSYTDLANEFNLVDNSNKDTVSNTDQAIYEYLLGKLGTSVDFFKFLVCTEMYIFACLLGYSDSDQSKYDNLKLSVVIDNISYTDDGFSCTFRNENSNPDLCTENNDGLSSFQMCSNFQQNSNSISQIFGEFTISNAKLIVNEWRPDKGSSAYLINFDSPQVYTYYGEKHFVNRFCDISVASTWLQEDESWVTSQAKDFAQQHTSADLIKVIYPSIVLE